MRKRPILLAALASAGVAMAQSSADFEIKAQAFNAGGQPVTVGSADFQIRLGSIGDSVAGVSLGSASFGVDSGFGLSFSPPGEVTGIRFTDPVTLAWNPEKSSGAYNLYRNLLSAIAPGFGACNQSNLPGETATDAVLPGAGTGFFYLVTAENVLAEEGTKGFQSSNVERVNAAPCP
ncbi:MAG TPA: hypothetical protein VFO11_13795 [Candidatus Polarisedimenticolaceae bacterium]|nr:hypothetical protein [Candidatus Polarisedimenticolaceae bacterium]